MIPIKSPKEIATMREGGKILARIMRELEKMVEPGIATKELNKVAEDLVLKYGAKPSFKGYYGADGELGKPFPAALCVSINEEIVNLPMALPIMQKNNKFPSYLITYINNDINKPLL